MFVYVLLPVKTVLFIFICSVSFCFIRCFASSMVSIFSVSSVSVGPKISGWFSSPFIGFFKFVVKSVLLIISVIADSFNLSACVVSWLFMLDCIFASNPLSSCSLLVYCIISASSFFPFVEEESSTFSFAYVAFHFATHISAKITPAVGSDCPVAAFL